MPRPSLVLLAVLAVGGSASTAQADTSSWLAVGGGYGIQRNSLSASTDRATTFTAAVGVGSTPRSPLIVGGLFRTTTYFTLGTDLGLAARIATRGFVRGDWGLALDVGPTARFWGRGDYGRYPLQALVVGGAPWGLDLGVGFDVWNLAGPPYARGAFAVLEVDLLRLTLMRQGSTESFWPNPAPAGGHAK